MKRFAVLLLASTFACASAPYPYMTVNYSFSTLDGATRLDVHLHNNGHVEAFCDVTVSNHSQTVTIAPTADETVSFESLPEAAEPNYSCISQ